MKHLILTSSGGGAHTTVAKAQKERLVQEETTRRKPSDLHEADTKALVQIIDIMGVYDNADNFGTAWVPTLGIPYPGLEFFSGRANVARWNDAQKRGGLKGVETQESLIDNQAYAEYIQSSVLYNNLKKTLEANEDLEEIIDTQALSTAEICRAVTEENARRADLNPSGKPIKVKKIISEFITDKTVHYLNPIGRIASTDRACLEVLVVNEPLRPESESIKEFYDRKNAANIEFTIQAPPLREEFKDNAYAQNKTVYLESSIDGNIPGPLKERNYLATLLQGQGTQDQKHFKITKRENDKFYTITLGSQGSVTMLRYIDAFIEQVTSTTIPTQERRMLFLLACKNTGESGTLYAMARKHIEQRRAELTLAGIPWPANAFIVPLANQDGKSMASLHQNSDVLITRTGGMSSIEVNATQEFNTTRRVLLHSEASPSNAAAFPKESRDACYDALLHGTVRWEGGNAQYLMKSIGASLTSPETVLFDIDGKAASTSFEDSLVAIASCDKLKIENKAKIEECLSHGSNPNLEAFWGLPALAYACDEETVELCIAYGGKLTPAVKTKLQEKIPNIDLNSLIKLETTATKETHKNGAPQAVINAFEQAKKDNNPLKIKGLLYRFPKLAALKMPTDRFNHTSLIIKQARGYSPLRVALKNPKQNPDLNKRLIYLHQQELNVTDKKGRTPLTRCKDPEERKLMVILGADPRYIAPSVNAGEREELRRIYSTSYENTSRMAAEILKIYYATSDDEDDFCTRASNYIQRTLRPDVHTEIDNTILKATFNEIKAAETEREKMNIIYSLIDVLMSLVGKDLISERTKKVSRSLFFTTQPTNQKDPEDPSDLLPTGNSTPTEQT